MKSCQMKHVTRISRFQKCPIGIAVALLTVDIIKKKEVTPYTLILVVYIGVFLLYELRYSTAYQTLGNFIARTVF